LELSGILFTIIMLGLLLNLRTLHVKHYLVRKWAVHLWPQGEAGKSALYIYLEFARNFQIAHRTYLHIKAVMVGEITNHANRFV